MKRSSIDIGSNSILLLYGEMDQERFIEKGSRAEVVGLGKGIDQTGKFSKEKMELAYSVLKDYHKLLRGLGYKTSETIVTATEASRNASNSKEFFKQIKEEFEFDVKIISPDGEAYYTSLGILKSKGQLKEKRSLLIDLGGASTELIEIDSNSFQITKMVSLKCGSVRAREWLDEGTYQIKIEELLKDSGFKAKYNSAIGIAGTFTTLASMYLKQDEFQIAPIENLKLEVKQLYDFLDSVVSLDEFPTAQSRKETIMSGARWSIDLLKFLEVKNLSFSTYGLRYGVLYEGAIQEMFLV